MGKVVFCADEASFRNDVVKGIEDHLKHPKTEGFVSLSYTHTHICIYIYIIQYKIIEYNISKMI